MTFQVVETPSGGVFFKGQLIQTRLARSAKREIVLCVPVSVEDVLKIHDELKLTMALQKRTDEVTPEQIEQATQENMTIMGTERLTYRTHCPIGNLWLPTADHWVKSKNVCPFLNNSENS